MRTNTWLDKLPKGLPNTELSSNPSHIAFMQAWKMGIYPDDDGTIIVISHQTPAHALHQIALLFPSPLKWQFDHENNLSQSLMLLALRTKLPSTPLAELSVENNHHPLAQLLSLIIDSAISSAASDIHIRPVDKSYLVQYRIDGSLIKHLSLSSNVAQRCLMRLKILSDVDIAEKRLPQDGQFKQDKTSIRLSFCPSAIGEVCVMRLHPLKEQEISFQSLGMQTAQCRQMQNALQKRHGLILIIGATGSGKTHTLYAALQTIVKQKRHVITVEDPVEMPLMGCQQMSVNPSIQLTFSRCLRAVLRQDPDVLAIGEIRDEDTAKIAIQAAMTGHLVLATLHAATFKMALHRLEHLGVGPSDVRSALSLCVMQRLIKTPPQGRTGVFKLMAA
ncbi:MAG: hypothetical protein DHS20C10_03710 [marine bacterium B5-7]|nr:MAG: hypothetical protein DHS20C10_03710 [marine bacterium B5-7]